MRLKFLVGVAALVSTTAFASETTLWKEIGSWDVAVDPTHGNTCFITTGYDSGAALRLGFNPQGAQLPVYLVVGGSSSSNWAAIEDGKEYPLRFQVDDEPPWDAVATGKTMGNRKTVWVDVGDVKFISEFVRKHWLKIFYKGRQVGNLSLAGSAAASKELVACQSMVNEALTSPQTPPPKNPFETAPNTGVFAL